jgi:hypothetical protein
MAAISPDCRCLDSKEEPTSLFAIRRECALPKLNGSADPKKTGSVDSNHPPFYRNGERVVGQTKSNEQDQAIRKAVAALTSQGRNVTTSAILATIHADGIKAKPSDIYTSTAWKELLAGEKGKSDQKPGTPTDEAPLTKTKSKH